MQVDIKKNIVIMKRNILKLNFLKLKNLQFLTRTFYLHFLSANNLINYQSKLNKKT